MSATHLPVNLQAPDNSLLVRGKPFLVEVAWHMIGGPLLRSELLPFPTLKRWVLRAFGARVGKRVYIKPGVKVKFPWYLSIGDYAWIGERVWIDNLARVSIGEHACISQDTYLCTGNHDWSTTNMRLFHRPINIGPGAWVAARSVLFPGVDVGTCALILGGSVVHHSVPPFEIHGGNPASFVKKRRIDALKSTA